MAKRTYKEAVDITVKWWSEKAFKTLLNQNNGDDSSGGGMAFLLMNMVSVEAQKETSEENVTKFESKLTELLLQEEGKGQYSNQCDVDYGPNKILFDACQFAGVNTRLLPCKTFTYINKDNEVEGRYQYGGDWFKL